MKLSRKNRLGKVPKLSGPRSFNQLLPTIVVTRKLEILLHKLRVSTLGADSLRKIREFAERFPQYAGPPEPPQEPDGNECDDGWDGDVI